jgi:tether containing UBX domain for GLUT4
MSHNEADYTPTVEHAQAHQKLLQTNSRNVRLKTEAELAAQADEEAAKWAQVKEVEVKIRFPDQSTVVTTFGQDDTASTLYSTVRDCLDEQWRSEVFLLRIPGLRGKNDSISDDSHTKLIKDLQLKGRVLLNFSWDEQKASVEARSAKSVLKAELRAKAEDIKVMDAPATQADDENDPGVRVSTSRKDNNTGEEGGSSKSKVPKWLKGLSKK